MANCVLLPFGDRLPVGFRFHPTDDELINYYLKNKTVGQESLVQYIRQVDVCKYEPWELRDLSNDQTGDHEWFFFSAQDLKYSTGSRSNRATKTGFWKSTGKDLKIMARGTNNLIGTKKTLVFHEGRVSNGIRTNWVIHEYRLHPDPNSAHLKSFVISRLKKKWDENDVMICDEAEPNGLLTKTIQNVAAANQNQEIPGNEQSLHLSDLQVSDYDIRELEYPLYSDPEPTSMDFQTFNSNRTNVTGPTDEGVDSIRVDDEYCTHKETPNSSSDFNWLELLDLDEEDENSGFSGDTGMDTGISQWKYSTEEIYYDHASPRLFGEGPFSRKQTGSRSIINESRRRPLTSKILKYGGAKDFSAACPPREYQINNIHSDNDDSDRKIRNFNSQRQPKYHKVVDRVDASQNVHSKRETQLQVVSSLSKAKAVPKRTKVRSIATSSKDNVENQEAEAENGVAYLSKSTGHGSLESGAKCSSIFLTTKCIHHKSSPASYFVKACIGVILFYTIIQQVPLF